MGPSRVRLGFVMGSSGVRGDSVGGPSGVRVDSVGGGVHRGSVGGTSGLEVSPSKERCAMCEFLGQLSNFHVVNLMIF